MQLQWKNSLFITFVTLISGINSKEQEYFSYEDQDAWGTISESCLFSLQSPINIRSSKAKVDKNLNLVFINYNQPISKNDYYWINDGHTVKLVKNSSQETHILTGSAVNNGHYQFKQMHFHWSDRNDYGSEHSVNGIKYSLELHLVHESLESSIFHHNKYAVLTSFFAIGKPHPFFNELMDIMHELVIENKRVSILHNDEKRILDILPNNLESFFTYNGSLTTPPCTQSVKWILLKKVQELSLEQLDSIRNLFNFDSSIRRMQPRNSRQVLTTDSLPMSKTSSAISNQLNNLNLTSISILSILIVIFVLK